MKNSVAVILTVGALISANNSYAGGKKDNPTLSSATNMQVSIDHVTPDSKVFIKDSKGQVLYSENIDHAGSFQKGFDVSSLPSNDYYLEVDKKAFVTVYPFTVKEHLAEFHEAEAREIMKPVLILDENQVKLMRNVDDKQTVFVEIYYQGQDLVHRERIDEEGKIGRIYDFSTSASGDYLFSIKYEDRKHTEYLSINTLY